MPATLDSCNAHCQHARAHAAHAIGTAHQTPTDKEWFQGTADAVRQYAWLLTDTKNRGIEDVVILSGDHL
jgi:ADP-glucose pyrophosphorylase